MATTTVDALLDAAEAEFATAGIETGSLRKIMRDAGADPGAVHYHFGGRDALAAAVLDRILAPLNARRLALLPHAIAAGQIGAGQTGAGRSSTSQSSAARLVEALIRPDIEAGHVLHAQSPGRARLIGAIYTRPSDFVTATVSAHFAPVATAFLPHLVAAMPHLGLPDIAWRIRWCVFGTVGALLADERAAFDRPADDLIAELVRTLAAALAT